MKEGGIRKNAHPTFFNSNSCDRCSPLAGTTKAFSSYYLNSIQFVKKDLVEKIILLLLIRKKTYTYVFSIIILKRVAQKGTCNFLFCPAWDGRIRTSEYRDQNPLPYHLATPHFHFDLVLIKSSIGIGCSSIPVQSLKIGFWF